MDRNWKYQWNSEIEESNGLKRLIKKFIKKGILFLFGPYAEFQNGVNAEIAQQLSDLEQSMIEMQGSQERLQEEMQKNKEQLLIELQQKQELLDRQEKHLEKLKSDLGAASRQIMLTKWRQIDHDRQIWEKPEDILTCDLCGYSQMRKDYEVKETDCIFNGGHLERYVCPGCGVIFGPDKFKNLGQDGIDEDYWVHYLGFQEGDSTEKEIRAFKMLHPTKDGIYLDYGCGSWSKTVDVLRAEGYQVYGYEPYASDIDNPYIIGGKDNIKDMRFDGIFSNDLLEHLINPIEDLKFMKSLLLRPESKMAHSTGCFAYKHEETRFHTHFFVANSANILAEKAGFEIIERCDDLEENDFICCVFKMKEDKISYLPLMHVSEGGIVDEKGVCLNPAAFMFGPYINMGKGDYTIRLDIDGVAEPVVLRCTSDMGQSLIAEIAINPDEKEITLNIPALSEKVEFVVKNETSDEIRITDICLL